MKASYKLKYVKAVRRIERLRRERDALLALANKTLDLPPARAPKTRD